MTLKGKRILIVAPHPDDEAICCGGLIMRAKKEKAKVFVMFMGVGSSRQFMNGRTSAQDRTKEVKKAQSCAKYEYEIITELSTLMDAECQKTFIEAIEDRMRTFKPDVVVIPYKESHNQDHRAIHTACVTALRPMPKKLLHQPDMILEMEEAYSWLTSFNPNFFIKIDILEKLKLYNCHHTQVPTDPNHPRSEFNLMNLAGLRGSNIGVRYAEGYKLLRGKL